MPLPHHPLGPSSFGRVSRCPGSLRLSRQLPPAEEDEIAARGTLLHRLVVPPEAPQEGWNGPREHPEALGLSSFDRAMLERARQWVKDLLERNAVPRARYEVSLHLPALEGVPAELLPWGWADLLADNGTEEFPPTVALIADHKTGPVEIDEEIAGAQVYLLALMVFESVKSVMEVKVAIYHWASDTEFSRIVTRNEVPHMRAHVRKAILEASDPNAPLNPSSAACSYCPALRPCPAARQVALSSWQEAGDLERYTPEALGALVDRVVVAEKALKAIRGAITELERKTPGRVAGWALHERRDRELAGAWKVSSALPELALPEFLEACRVSVTALDEVWGNTMKTRKGGYKKQHIAELAVRLQRLKLVTLGEPSYYLKRTHERKELENG